MAGYRDRHRGQRRFAGDPYQDPRRPDRTLGGQTLGEHDVAPRATLPPGKSTLSADLPTAPLDAMRAFDAQFDIASHQLAALHAANRASDHYASGIAASALCAAFHSAERLIAHARASNGEHASEMETRLTKAREDARSALDLAFTPSRDAIREAVNGAERSQWDREVAVWHAARGHTRPTPLEPAARAVEPRAGTLHGDSLGGDGGMRPVSQDNTHDPRAISFEKLERRGDPSPSPLAIAGAGVAGSGRPLPFAAELQASFGAHDLSGVRAHTDAAAGDAARSLGARAYTLGNEIAFDGAPTLELVAHEAAHVVQQRSGVALKDALDRPGDEHEQHADAVADAVIRGEPAEPLLDRITGRGATAAPTVQRNTAPARSATAARPTPPIYVNQNASQILAAIGDRLKRVGVPEPHPRLRWKVPTEATAALSQAIRTYVQGSPDQTLKRLMELSQPADLFAIVDDQRRTPGWFGWRPEIGAAIAAAFDEPIAVSMQRMGVRLRARLDAQTGMPNPSTLVASCPLDRVIGELLVKPALVVVGAKQRGGPDDTPGQMFEHGPRVVAYEWQGARDPALWNWIRVQWPADATVEEVAQIPFVGPNVSDSEQAYRIAASPPFFGIPFETAKHVPAAVQYASFDLQRRFPLGDPGPRFANRAVLARSPVADDAALAQAPKPAKDDPPVDRALERVRIQLEFMQQRLAPWRAAKPLAGAQRFVERRRAELASDRRKAEKWTAAIAAQERILYGAASELAEMLGELQASGATATAAASLGPVVRVLEAYAQAVGVSHLRAEAPAALDAARRLRGLLPLALAEDKIHLAREAVSAQQGAQFEANSVEPHARETIESIPALSARGADLRLEASRTGVPSTEAIEELAADADLTNLRARIVTLQTQLRAVENRATSVGLPEAKYRDGLPTLRAFPAALRAESRGWFVYLDDKNVHFGAGAGSERRRHTERKRRVIKDVENRLATYKELAGIGKPDGYFVWAAQQIADKQMRDLVAGIAVQLAILAATGPIAGAAFAALRGAAVGAEVVSGLRAAGTIFKAGEVISQAGLATATQAAMGGTFGRRELTENALSIVLGNAAMRPLRGLLHQSGALEREVRTLAQAAARGGKFVTELALDVGTSVAATGVARMVVHGGNLSIASNEEWISQAISFGVSRFVHQRVQRIRERIQATKREGSAAQAQLEAVMKEVETLQKQAAAAKPPSLDAAQSLLVKYRQLLEHEKPLHAAGPARPAQATNAADLAASTQSGIELPLHLAKLSPVVAGEVYEGSSAQIRAALNGAKAMGIELMSTYDAKSRTWRVTSGARVIEIREPAPVESEPPTASKTDPHAGKKSGPGAAKPHTAPETKPAKTPKPLEHPADAALKKASPEDRKLLERVVALDADEGRRLIQDYGDDLLEHLHTQPLTTLGELRSTLAKLRAQVKVQVPGLYAGIDTTNPPAGWRFDTYGPHVDIDGVTKYIETRVYGPNGAEGRFERAYDPRTKELELRVAFLKLSGKDQPLPNMMPKQGSSPEMVAGKGTPTVQYVTIYQMKKLGVPIGSASGAPGVEKIHLSSIQNVETVVHLHYLRKTTGGELSDLVAFTASVKYAEATAIQSGYRRSDEPLLTGGKETPIRELLEFQEGGNAQRRAENDQILAKYGFDRDTVMRWSFDIDFLVSPLSTHTP